MGCIVEVIMKRKILLLLLLLFFIPISSAATYPDAPENLTSVAGLNNVLLEWDNLTGVDNYSICVPLPSVYNLTYAGISPPIIDGALDANITNFSQHGIMKSPNPIDTLTYESIWTVHDADSWYMMANTTDNDADPNDDYIEVFVDTQRDGLTTDDRGYRIKENGALTYLKWSGSAWISSGGTTANVAVSGAGTNNVIYELRVPKSEIPVINDGDYIDLIVRRTNTYIATTYTFFPESTGYTIESTDGWQTLYISPYDEPASFYCETSDTNYHNFTGLDSYSAYLFCVAGVSGGVPGNTTCIEAITLDYPTYNVSGYVYDSDTNNPVFNATVVLTDTFTVAYAVTNATGYYAFPGIHNDDYTIKVTKDDYGISFEYITVSGFDYIVDDIYLSPSIYANSNEMDFMPLSIFVLLLVIAIVFTLYCFYFTDRENYTHIILALVSAIILLITGYNSYIGIGFLYPLSSEVSTYYYQSSHIAGLLILYAMFMAACGVAWIFDLARESAEENNI